MADNTSNFESNMLSVVEFDIFAQFPLKQVNNHTPIQLLFYLEHIYWSYIDNYAKKDKENQFPHFSFDEFVKKGTRSIFLNRFTLITSDSLSVLTFSFTSCYATSQSSKQSSED